MSDEILNKFLAGTATEREQQQCEQWLADPETVVNYHDTCRDELLDALRSASGVVLDRDAAEELAKRLQQTWAHVESNPESYAEFLGPAEVEGELGTIGKYRVIELLAVGGMGLVFRCIDAELQRTVCLKLMRPSRRENREARERFQREVRDAAGLVHDRLVPVIDAGVQQGVPWFAMPLLDGHSLRKAMERGPISVEQTLRFVRQVAQGLAYTHQCGLIHRDIKPDNLWLTTDGEVKILDFGLARPTDVVSPLTHDGTVIGTPSYMSPEQVQGNRCDQRSDLFSLGVVMVEMLTGVSPFDRANLVSTLMAIAGEHVDWERLDPEARVSVDIRQVIDRLLQKDPDQRFHSAEKLLAALDSLPNEFQNAAGVRQLASGSRGNFRSWLIGAAFGGFACWSAMAIWAWNDKGTLVVETSDPNVEIKIANEKVTLFDPLTEKTYRVQVGETKLPTGVYQLEATELTSSGGSGGASLVPKTGLVFSASTIAIRRGQDVIVTVTLKPSEHPDREAVPATASTSNDNEPLATSGSERWSDPTFRPDLQDEIIADLKRRPAIDLTSDSKFDQWAEEGLFGTQRLISNQLHQNYGEAKHATLATQVPSGRVGHNCDRSLFASVGRHVKVFDAETGQLKFVLPNQGVPVRASFDTVTPNLLVTTFARSEPKPGESAYVSTVWRLQEDGFAQPIHIVYNDSSFAFLRNGYRLFCVRRNAIEIIGLTGDFSTGFRLSDPLLMRGFRGWSVSPNGQFIAVTSESLTGLWDLKREKPLVFTTEKRGKMTWSADSSKLAITIVRYLGTSPDESDLEVWSTDGNRLHDLRLTPGDKRSFKLVLEPNFQRIAWIDAETSNLLMRDLVSARPGSTPIPLEIPGWQSEQLPATEASLNWSERGLKLKIAKQQYRWEATLTSVDGQLTLEKTDSLQQVLDSYDLDIESFYPTSSGLFMQFVGPKPGTHREWQFEIRRFDPSTGYLSLPLATADWIQTTTLSPNGKRLLYALKREEGSNNTTWVNQSLETGETALIKPVLDNRSGQAFPVGWSENSRYVMLQTNQQRLLFDAGTGEQIHSTSQQAIFVGNQVFEFPSRNDWADWKPSLLDLENMQRRRLPALDVVANQLRQSVVEYQESKRQTRFALSFAICGDLLVATAGTVTAVGKLPIDWADGVDWPEDREVEFELVPSARNESVSKKFLADGMVVLASGRQVDVFRSQGGIFHQTYADVGVNISKRTGVEAGSRGRHLAVWESSQLWFVDLESQTKTKWLNQQAIRNVAATEFGWIIATPNQIYARSYDGLELATLPFDLLQDRDNEDLPGWVFADGGLVSTELADDLAFVSVSAKGSAIAPLSQIAAGSSAGVPVWDSIEDYLESVGETRIERDSRGIDLPAEGSGDEGAGSSRDLDVRARFGERLPELPGLNLEAMADPQTRFSRYSLVQSPRAVEGIGSWTLCDAQIASDVSIQETNCDRSLTATINQDVKVFDKSGTLQYVLPTFEMIPAGIAFDSDHPNLISVRCALLGDPPSYELHLWRLDPGGAVLLDKLPSASFPAFKNYVWDSGYRFLSLTNDGLNIYRLDTKTTTTFDHEVFHNRVGLMNLVGEGRYLLAFSNEVTNVFDLDQQSFLFALTRRGSAEISNDGKELVYRISPSSKNEFGVGFQIWDLESRTIKREIARPILRDPKLGNRIPAKIDALSPDQNQLAWLDQSKILVRRLDDNLTREIELDAIDAEGFSARDIDHLRFKKDGLLVAYVRKTQQAWQWKLEESGWTGPLAVDYDWEPAPSYFPTSGIDAELVDKQADGLLLLFRTISNDVADYWLLDMRTEQPLRKVFTFSSQDDRTRDPRTIDVSLSPEGKHLLVTERNSKGFQTISLVSLVDSVQTGARPQQELIAEYQVPRDSRRKPSWVWSADRRYLVLSLLSYDAMALNAGYFQIYDVEKRKQVLADGSFPGSRALSDLRISVGPDQDVYAFTKSKLGVQKGWNAWKFDFSRDQPEPQPDSLLRWPASVGGTNKSIDVPAVGADGEKVAFGSRDVGSSPLPVFSFGGYWYFEVELPGDKKKIFARVRPNENGQPTEFDTQLVAMPLDARAFPSASGRFVKFTSGGRGDEKNEQLNRSIFDFETQKTILGPEKNSIGLSLFWEYAAWHPERDLIMLSRTGVATFDPVTEELSQTEINSFNGRNSATWSVPAGTASLNGRLIKLNDFDHRVSASLLLDFGTDENASDFGWVFADGSVSPSPRAKQLHAAFVDGFHSKCVPLETFENDVLKEKVPRRWGLERISD